MPKRKQNQRRTGKLAASGRPSTRPDKEPSGLAQDERAESKGPGLPGTKAEPYTHDQKRLNNPTAGQVEFDPPPRAPSRSYAYDPHLDPQLQWAGKAEKLSLDVDTVSLHIHERVDTRAVLRAVQRAPAQTDLFARAELDASRQIAFYEHEVGWANRLVLGDSLVVMNSLLERERMAGQVQCVYMDPPYGVKFNSNFQPAISRRDVKDGDDESLTREPEQIQAYRDTWTLGVHSYLSYLRDRLMLARELLAESGSIFVQISDENVHHVREVMDEVFGAGNFVVLVCYRRLGSMIGELLQSTAHYLVWYAKEKRSLKYKKLFDEQLPGIGTGDHYTQLENRETGAVRPLTPLERANPAGIDTDWRPFQLVSLATGGFRPNTTIDYVFDGRTYHPGSNKCWRTTREGLDRLARAGRIVSTGGTIRYKQYLGDFPLTEPTTIWDDAARDADSLYVVQTPSTIIRRCVLMTSDPGDLVLDPTCGSGTTAMVAEQWGRRWITCDTSRVALAIARARILTAKFPYYELRGPKVRDGLRLKTVPHVTLASIAQNPKLDACRTREEMERVIRESAGQETLYDQPFEDARRVRISGPFTVEAIPQATVEEEARPPPQPSPESARGRECALEAPPAPSPSPALFAGEGRGGGRPDFVGYLLDQMAKTGVHFDTKAGTRHLPLSGLRAVKSPFEWVHAEAGTGLPGDTRRVAVSFGPKHGPVTARQVFDALPQTRDYDVVLFVGFACDPEARKVIDQYKAKREVHFVQAAPDILVGDLLKTQTKKTRLFTVFGAPDVKVHKDKDGQISVELTGIDLYDPHTGETQSSDGDRAAAWFLDQDYDGRTFCVSQAFFPARGTKNPWEKLQKALRAAIDEERFEALRGTRSLPFKPGARVAVKVVDDRGNEVVKVVEV